MYIYSVYIHILNSPIIFNLTTLNILKHRKSTKLLNNITEYPTTYDDLMIELDTLYEKKGSGLLTGLPISVKECMAISGTDSTAGTSRRIGEIHEEDAVLIQVLRKQGALVSYH